MRKRQKTRKKKVSKLKRKHTDNGQIDDRDRDWLTSGDQFAASVAKSDVIIKKRGKQQRTIGQTDVSLQEYADNPQAPASNQVRKAKGAKTILHKELVKMEKEKKQEEDSVIDDWFLQDSDSDFEYDPGSVEDDTELSQDAKNESEASGECEKDSALPAHESFVYPADLWYILSSYISPPQVGCFAAICKDAYIVTTTAAFWKNLYQRFYQADAKLPVELQPCSMFRIYSIRTLVIHALHMMYQPYVSHIKSIPAIGDEGNDSPECLVNRTCMYMWSRGQVGCHFYHFFKFREKATPPDIVNYNSEEVYANSHTNECILKVFCQNFQHFPSDQVMGSKLVTVSVSVSSNFRYHKLKLQFTTKEGRLRKGRSRESDLLSVVLDPVILVRVLHWWHRQFQESLNQGIVYGTASTISAASAVWEGRV